jgi:transcriptional regulator with XRE-family HTH domain
MLAKNLKKILEDKNISISELAKETGVPKSTIMQN